MTITFLGTGTSQGVPVIACSCEVCMSDDRRDNRLRTSVHIQSEKTSVIIDTGPDFRYQVLRENIRRVDAILYTHEHKDHTAGLDDIRGFNFAQKEDIPIYARRTVLDQLKKEFSYIFNPNSYPGVPRVIVNEIVGDPFQLGDLTITPIEVQHLRLPVYGFMVGGFCYITDANFIGENEIEMIRGCKVLVINALQKQDHVSHFNLSEALEVIEKIGPGRAYLTHVSHRMGLHEEVDSTLPENVRIAYDGLQVTV